MIEQELANGVGRIVNHENIAIAVLMIVCVGQGLLNLFLLKHVFAMKDVMAKVNNAITKLNERLNNHD